MLSFANRRIGRALQNADLRFHKIGDGDTVFIGATSPCWARHAATAVLIGALEGSGQFELIVEGLFFELGQGIENPTDAGLVDSRRRFVVPWIIAVAPC